jgi:alanine racemase
MVSLVVEREKVIKNAQILSDLMGETAIIGVVKGNGYGLGLSSFASLLRECGVTRFAVSRLEEALILRKNGFVEDILNLTPVVTYEEAEEMVNNNITATVASYDNAVLLNGAAEATGRVARVHIKIDTGFGRFGFLPSETDRVAAIGQFLKSVEIEGIYTHLHSAFGKEETVKAQYDQFVFACDVLKGEGIAIPICHMANSCGALRFAYTRLNAVRIGSAFLGRLPVKNKWGLLRVGHLQSRVIDTKWLPKGHNIGYGQGYKTKSARRVGVVEIGYTDGFDVEKSKDTFRIRDVIRYLYHDFRSLLGNRRPTVQVEEKKIQVIGRVTMCHTMIDITNTDIKVGDSVRIECNPLYVPATIKREYV